MAARAGNTTYVPGKGSYTRGKSGKAKSYSGKGPAPSGSVKTPEKGYSEVPTVIVKPSGEVTTSGMKTAQQMAEAVKAHERGQRRIRAILNTHLGKPAPKVKQSPTPKAPKPQATKAPKVVMKDGAPMFVPVNATAKSATPGKPVAFHGHKTAGAPTAKELKGAAQAGTLKVNKAGFVVTPKVAKVSAKLKRVRKAVAKKSVPRISGIDNPDQREFAEYLSKFSKLPPKLAGEWVKQEGGGWGSEGVSGGEAGEQNWLGVGYPAHKTPFSESHYFNNTTPKKAAKATAKWMEGKIGSNFGYHAADSIVGISKLAKSGASEEEIRAYIEGPSAWGTGTIAQSGVSASGGGKVPPKLRVALKDAKAEARELGINTGSAKAPPKVVKRFKAIKVLAKKISKMGIPYVYGGGHNGGMPDPSEGLDCSSSTVFLLKKAGVKIPNITSGEFGNYLPPGPGAVTVFYNPTHVFLRIGDEYWGTSAGDSGSGGLGFHPAPSPEYLSQYSVAHVPGLGKKQAIQLGFGDLAGGSSFPGVTFSNGGTTATITESSTISGEPGFSKKPIRLTPRQVVNRANRKLKALTLAPTGGNESSSAAGGSTTLSDLQKKYGAAVV